jgi:cell division ATP-binding protein FtsE
MIRLESVTRQHPGGDRPALRHVDLEVAAGEFVFLVGPSGSGKSTLLRLLLGEDRPTEGRVTVLGSDLGALPEEDVPYLRRRIGTVFQDFRLLPGRTVGQNIAFALRAVGRPPGYVERAVPEALALVGLSGKQGRLPHELSGGEQQRVAIARAIANRPPLLLADEPTGNLDPAASREVFALLERINALGTTVVLTTHDADAVDRMRRRVVQLSAGEIVRDERAGGYAPSPDEAATDEDADAVRTTGSGHAVEDGPSGGVSGIARADGTARRPWWGELDGVRRRLIAGETATELVRNAPVVASVVLVTLVSLTFVAVAVLLQLQLDRMQDFWRERAQVAVTLCAESSASAACADGAITDAQITDVRQRLASDILAPFIADVRFQSSAQAYREALGSFGDSYAALISPEQMNATFYVTLRDPSEAEVVVEAFGGLAGVEAVEDQLRYLDPIFTALAIATYVAAGLALVVLVAAILLMGSTIRISVQARRREVAVMRLVGAPEVVVKAPFVLEGMVAGALGALGAAVVVYALVDVGVHGFLQRDLAFVGAWIGAPELAVVLPLLVVAGTALGAAASWVSVQRWLRERG